MRNIKLYKIIIIMIGSLMLLACGPEHRGPKNKTVQNLKVSQEKIIYSDTLILKIRPQIVDHRGGPYLLERAKTNFLEQWLPYADSYIFVDATRSDIQHIESWIAHHQVGVDILVVNLNNWDQIPVDIQEQAFFSHYIKISGYTSYEVTPIEWASHNEMTSFLSNKEFDEFKNRDDWIEDWMLSTQKPVKANCYSLALQATGIDVNFPSQVSAQKFSTLLLERYGEVDFPQTGDLAVFKMDDKYIVHAAVFFGYSETNISQKIFLSKNGKGNGMVQFIDEFTLLNKNYKEASEVTYWRRLKQEIK